MKAIMQSLVIGVILAAGISNTVRGQGNGDSLQGDFNLDGAVNLLDYQRFALAFGSETDAELTGDGVNDLRDWAPFRDAFGAGNQDVSAHAVPGSLVLDVDADGQTVLRNSGDSVVSLYGYQIQAAEGLSNEGWNSMDDKGKAIEAEVARTGVPVFITDFDAHALSLGEMNPGATQLTEGMVNAFQMARIGPGEEWFMGQPFGAPAHAVNPHFFYLNASQSASGFESVLFQGDIIGEIEILRTTMFGDADGDGIVGLADFLILSANFGMQVDPVDGFRQGDFDGDGTVGLADYTILRENFGPRSSVPEPSTWMLAILSALALFRVRRTMA